MPDSSGLTPRPSCRKTGVTKRIPRNAAEEKKETVAVEPKSLFVKRRNCTIGCGFAQLDDTNAIISATPIPAAPGTSGECPALPGSLIQREHQAGESKTAEQESGDIESARRLLPDVLPGRARQKSARRCPTGTLTKKMACQENCSTRMPPTSGPSRRADDECEHEDARDAYALFGRIGAIEHRHADRGQQAHRRLPERRGRAPAFRSFAPDRSADEPVVKRVNAKQKDALGPEAVAQPAGGGDEHRHTDQIADQDALHFVRRSVELAAERGKGHGHHGRVERVHQHAADIDDSDDELLIELARTQQGHPIECPTEWLDRVRRKQIFRWLGYLAGMLLPPEYRARLHDFRRRFLHRIPQMTPSPAAYHCTWRATIVRAGLIPYRCISRSFRWSMSPARTTHALDPLSVEEIAEAVRLVRENGDRR